ncbi:hypothetical protein SLNHY_6970 [Streptomyces albus]|nr:hypothetical protein SLNHY_6970 [Streptomyces albus]
MTRLVTDCLDLRSALADSRRPGTCSRKEAPFDAVLGASRRLVFVTRALPSKAGEADG